MLIQDVSVFVILYIYYFHIYYLYILIRYTLCINLDKVITVAAKIHLIILIVATLLPLCRSYKILQQEMMVY